MKILTLSSNPFLISESIKKCCQLLKSGKIIIAPTETAYGLLADARIEKALCNLFALKRRSLDKPSAIFVPDYHSIADYARDISPKLQAGIQKSWPGPVTFVVSSKIAHWPGVVSDAGTIGLRCSSHSFIQKLVMEYPGPLTSTSANLSGNAITSIDDLKNIFANQVEMLIIDENLGFNGLPSTVVDLTQNQIKILREGAVTRERIQEAFGNVKK